MISPKTVPFLCFAFFSVPALEGAVVVDQHVGHSGVFFNGLYLRQNGSAGQSFTPALSSIQYIRINTLSSADYNIPLESTIRFSLFLGETRSMGAIAISPEMVVRPRLIESSSGGFDMQSYVVDPVTWILDSPIAISEGSRYSFHIDLISGDDLEWTASYESYSGGRALFTGFGGVENETMNFSFSEGIVIPEPSSFLMLAGTVLILSTARRRSAEPFMVTGGR